MYRTKTYQDSQKSSAAPPAAPSRALEWLWQNLRDVRHPHILDCGPVYQATLDVLLKRGAKLYFTDLVTLARQSDSKFTRQLGKRTVFLIDEFLGNLPPIPPDSLSAIACWHLWTYSHEMRFLVWWRSCGPIFGREGYCFACYVNPIWPTARKRAGGSTASWSSGLMSKARLPSRTLRSPIARSNGLFLAATSRLSSLASHAGRYSLASKIADW